jgi:Txe/YoeB family toxin of Txe-Axe toxin-antitoxin module
MAASFLISAKAYTTEDGKVVVKLDSTFARDMVAREGAPEALRAALSVCLSRKLDTADILYEVEDNRVKAQDSLIDLIIEAADE